MPKAKVIRKLTKPILLTCAVCNKETRGRQWHNRDKGFGLCRDCLWWLEQRVAEGRSEDIEGNYGINGVHYNLEEGETTTEPVQNPVQILLDEIKQLRKELALTAAELRRQEQAELDREDSFQAEFEVMTCRNNPAGCEKPPKVMYQDIHLSLERAIDAYDSEERQEYASDAIVTIRYKDRYLQVLPKGIIYP